MTFYLNSINWWQYPDEPFFTNCSKFNATLTWIIWLSSMFGLIIYGIIFLVGLIVMINKIQSEGFIVVTKYICNACRIIGSFIFKFLGLFILGQSVTALGNFISERAGIQDDEFYSADEAE